MDALGDLLAPYSEQIAQIAGTITTLQFLSGAFMMNDIRKAGKSDSYPAEIFLIGLVLSVLSIKFGLVINDAAMTNVNIIGLIITSIFMSIFYYYASNEFRSKIWKLAGYMALFTLGCLAYASLEDPSKLQFRFSLLITMILVALVGSPLLNLGKIIKSKSTEGLPFPMILSGTLVALSWAVYGISIKNSSLLYQNLLLLVLSSIQLSLFAIYPSKPSESQKKLKKNNKKAE